MSLRLISGAADGDGVCAYRAAAPGFSGFRYVLGWREIRRERRRCGPPRFEERDGGYTRILRLAKTRIGDSGQQAILEFVGVHDREATRGFRRVDGILPHR